MRTLPGRGKALAALSSAALLIGVAACGADGAATAPGSQTTSGEATAVLADATVSTAMASNIEYVTADTSAAAIEGAIDIALAGSTATSDSDAVEMSEGTLEITAGGTYRLSGELAGQVVVDADGEAVTLVLDGVDITSESSAAVAFMDAGAAVVILAEGSTNSLTDATTYVYPDAETDEPNAALFSMTDLVIGGTGSLAVTGRSNDGIGSQDGLVITGGDLTVTGADDGIRGKDYLVITGGTIAVEAADDGLKSDNETDEGTGYLLLEDGTVTVAAGDDAVKGEQQVLIAGGSLTVTESVEGIEAAVVIIDDGDIAVTASDDGVNAAAAGDSAETDNGPGGGFELDTSLIVAINGGTLAVNADGDGLDSNGYLVITGGTVTVDGPTGDGNGAIDAGAVTVTGGSLVAVGSAGMAQTPGADSTQGWAAASFATQPAGATVTVTGEDGAVIAEYTAAKSFASVVLSQESITTGARYTVSVDGTAVATVTAGEALAGGFGPGGPGGDGSGGRGPGGPGEPVEQPSQETA